MGHFRAISTICFCAMFASNTEAGKGHGDSELAPMLAAGLVTYLLSGSASHHESHSVPHASFGHGHNIGAHGLGHNFGGLAHHIGTHGLGQNLNGIGAHNLGGHAHTLGAHGIGHNLDGHAHHIGAQSLGQNLGGHNHFFGAHNLGGNAQHLDVHNIGGYTQHLDAHNFGGQAQHIGLNSLELNLGDLGVGPNLDVLGQYHNLEGYNLRTPLDNVETAALLRLKHVPAHHTEQLSQV